MKRAQAGDLRFEISDFKGDPKRELAPARLGIRIPPHLKGDEDGQFSRSVFSPGAGLLAKDLVPEETRLSSSVQTHSGALSKLFALCLTDRGCCLDWVDGIMAEWRDARSNYSGS